MFIRKKSVMIFLLPGMLLLLIFHLIPFFGGIYLSMLDGSKANHFVGFLNYTQILRNTMFRIGLRNTLELSMLCAPLLWITSFFLAAIMVEISPFGQYARSIVFLPYLMPSSAILFIWLLLFDYGGPANRIMFFLTGTRVMWLESSALRLPIVLMFVWKNLGFSTVIFIAALQSIPAPLYEYARLEGAGFLQRTWYISMPMIIPTAFLALILAWINSFRIFKDVYFIAGGYPDRSIYTLQHYMNNMFLKMNYQYVTSSAYMFALLALILFGILFLLQRNVVKSVQCW